MTETSTTIPKPGDWIRTDHHCWWNHPQTNRPAIVHNEPIKVDRVVDMGGVTGRWRVEATRCDGTLMHLVLDDRGDEVLIPWDSARTGYEIVPAPEASESGRLVQCSNPMCPARATRQTYAPEQTDHPWDAENYVPWCAGHAPAGSWPLVESEAVSS
jgi:hypothetical protein